MGINAFAIKSIARSMDDIAKAMPAAERNAVHRVGAQIRQSAVAEIRNQIVLPARHVLPAITLRKQQRRPEVSIAAPGKKRIEIRTEPTPKPHYLARVTPRGILARTRKSGPPLEIKSSFPLKRFGSRVYLRHGTPRLPIRPIYGPYRGKRLPIKRALGPSIQSQFSKPKVQSRMDATWERNIEPILIDELDKVLFENGFK